MRIMNEEITESERKLYCDTILLKETDVYPFLDYDC